MRLPVAADARNRLAGIGLTIFSTFIFGLSNVLAKWSTAVVPLGEALALRSLVALMIIAPFLRLNDIVAAARGNGRLHLLRMVVSAVEIACYYWAIAKLQLADVSTFYLSSPILLIAISAVVLREVVGRARWIATLVGFAGVLIALRPTEHAVSWPACIALLGSVLYSVVLACTRGLRRTANTVLVAVQQFAVLLFGVALLPFGWVTPSLPVLLFLGGVGAISIVGSVCVNRALQVAPASVIAPFQYTGIVWSILLGYVVFADVPEPATLAGAAIIIGAGLFILLHERMRASREAL